MRTSSAAAGPSSGPAGEGPRAPQVARPIGTGPDRFLMKTKLTSLLNFFGLQVQGDIGPITCYRSARQPLIWFLKAPPKKPLSALQAAQIAKWVNIIDDWKALTPTQRANWLAIAAKASLSIQGFNLYIWWRSAEDDTIIETLERQTGIDVLP